MTPLCGASDLDSSKVFSGFKVLVWAMDQYQYLLMCRIFTCKKKPNVRIHFTMYTVNMSMIHGWYAGHAPFIRWTRIESPHSPNGEKGAGVYSSNGFPWTILIRATGHWGPPKCHNRVLPKGHGAFKDVGCFSFTYSCKPSPLPSPLGPSTLPGTNSDFYPWKLIGRRSPLPFGVFRTIYSGFCCSS